MADEIKIPDFNLGDEFSEDGNNFQQKPSSAESIETPKPKPKLLFEDEDSSSEPVIPQIPRPEQKRQERPQAQEYHPPEPPQDNAQKPGKKPKRIWLWLIPILILIIAGGSFFLQTQGYFDFSVIFVEAGKVKDKIFGGSDTLSAASTDSSKTPAASTPATNPYEDQFLRKPVSKQSAEPAQKTNEVKTDVISGKTAPMAEPKAAVKIIDTKTSGKYSIQVSAWKMKSKAASEVRKIKAKGLNVKLTTVTLPQKGGTWYRVMVGSYSTSEKAKFDTDKIKRITNSENCIIREN